MKRRHARSAVIGPSAIERAKARLERHRCPSCCIYTRSILGSRGSPGD
jgi:hypothetical protein